MLVLDLLIVDEFNEPVHCTSTPVKLSGDSLFENELNLDMQADLAQKDNEVISICYKYSKNKAHKEAEVVVMVQMSYKPDEDYTYVTNLEVKLSLNKINEWFNT